MHCINILPLLPTNQQTKVPRVAPHLGSFCFWVPAIVSCLDEAFIRVKWIDVYTVCWREIVSIKPSNRIRSWKTWLPKLSYIESVTILPRKIFIVKVSRVFCEWNAFGVRLSYWNWLLKVLFSQCTRTLATFSWCYNGRDEVSNHQPHDCSTVHSAADQRKHQSSPSLAFVRAIHPWAVNSPHKWPVTQKMFPFDDVIMKQKVPIPGLLVKGLDNLFARTRVQCDTQTRQLGFNNMALLI